MKKYFFETPVTQREKPCERGYLFCAPARCFVLAEDEASAFVLAKEKLCKEYQGTGRLLLGEMKLTKTAPLPTDWSYGYENERTVGATDAGALAALVASSVIR